MTEDRAPDGARDARARRFALVALVAAALSVAAIAGTAGVARLTGVVPTAGERWAVEDGPAAGDRRAADPGAVPGSGAATSPSSGATTTGATTLGAVADPVALVATARDCRAVARSTAGGAAADPGDESVPASQAAGRALLANPAVQPCPGAGAALASGSVDGRLLALLALAADRWSYRLATIGVDDGHAVVTALLTDLEELPGHADPGAPVPADTVVSWFTAQRPPFRPDVVAAVDPRTVVVSFATGAPSAPSAPAAAGSGDPMTSSTTPTD